MSDLILLEPEGMLEPKEDTFEEYLEKFKGDYDMQEVQSLKVTLLRDYIEVALSNNSNKIISYSDFRGILDSNMGVVSAVQDIQGMLPPSNMIFLSQTSTKMYINSYYSSAEHDMLYLTSKKRIITPNIIIAWTLTKEGKDWLVTATNFFCTDLNVNKLQKNFINALDHTKGIYDLPMSNTYGGGSMCYGSNSMPARFRDNNLRGLDWYFRYLWETPFNNDLGIRAINDRIGVESWYNKLAERAKVHGTFPYCDLRNYTKIDGSPESTSVLKDKD